MIPPRHKQSQRLKIRQITHNFILQVKVATDYISLLFQKNARSKDKSKFLLAKVSQCPYYTIRNFVTYTFILKAILNIFFRNSLFLRRNPSHTFSWCKLCNICLLIILRTCELSELLYCAI